MRRFCDLHTHSTASDGSSTPVEVVALAERAKLAGVALTDHDTVAGLEEAARTAEGCPDLMFLPGVEVSAIPPRNGTLHVLGLCVQPRSEALAELLERLLRDRNTRNPMMIDRLRAMGVEISLEELAAGAAARPGQEAPVLGRAHMAGELVRKGYARDVRDAFDRYLGRGAPAYVEKDRLRPAEVIDGIHRAGGLAVLAHPVQLGFENFAQCERLVRELKQDGLDGLEVYHADHDERLTRYFLDLAGRLDLLVTGGSDFHGAAKPEVRLGHPRVPAHFMRALLARAGQNR